MITIMPGADERQPARRARPLRVQGRGPQVLAARRPRADRAVVAVVEHVDGLGPRGARRARWRGRRRPRWPVAKRRRPPAPGPHADRAVAVVVVREEPLPSRPDPGLRPRRARCSRRRRRRLLGDGVFHIIAWIYYTHICLKLLCCYISHILFNLYTYFIIHLYSYTHISHICLTYTHI